MQRNNCAQNMQPSATGGRDGRPQARAEYGNYNGANDERPCCSNSIRSSSPPPQSSGNCPNMFMPSSNQSSDETPRPCSPSMQSAMPGTTSYSCDYASYYRHGSMEAGQRPPSPCCADVQNQRSAPLRPASPCQRAIGNQNSAVPQGAAVTHSSRAASSYRQTYCCPQRPTSPSPRRVDRPALPPRARTPPCYTSAQNQRSVNVCATATPPRTPSPCQRGIGIENISLSQGTAMPQRTTSPYRDNSCCVQRQIIRSTSPSPRRGDRSAGPPRTPSPYGGSCYAPQGAVNRVQSPSPTRDGRYAAQSAATARQAMQPKMVGKNRPPSPSASTSRAKKASSQRPISMSPGGATRRPQYPIIAAAGQSAIDPKAQKLIEEFFGPCGEERASYKQHPNLADAAKPLAPGTPCKSAHSKKTPSQLCESPDAIEAEAARRLSGMPNTAIAQIEPPICSHNSHILEDNELMQEMPLSNFEQLLEKMCSETERTNAMSITRELSQIYIGRLKDIEKRAAGCCELKLLTYQEWVEMLIKINHSIICQMESLEAEVTARLQLLEGRANMNCRSSQGNELMKCRKDIDTLLKFIHRAYHRRDWSLNGLTFETITPSDLMVQMENCDSGCAQLSGSSDSETPQQTQLWADKKALALEVAAKHNEVMKLKEQVTSLEDEIQKAQKKINLKDEFIKELRNDLKRMPQLVSPQESSCSSATMPPINVEADTTALPPSESATHVCAGLSLTLMNESLDAAQQQQEFDIMQALNHDMGEKDKSLRGIVMKLYSDKNSVIQKLNFLRQQLLVLEDETLSQPTSEMSLGSHSENDNDCRLIEAIRKRMLQLIRTNEEQRKREDNWREQHSQILQEVFKHTETISEISKLVNKLTTVDGAIAGALSRHEYQNPLSVSILKMIDEKNASISELKMELMTRDCAPKVKEPNISESENIECITPPPMTLSDSASSEATVGRH